MSSEGMGEFAFAEHGRRVSARHHEGGGGRQVLMTGVGLKIPVDLSFDEWEQAGRKLSDLVDSTAWWLGDWLVYGKKHYSDRYQRAIRAVGLSYQTLRNYAWVARRFEIGTRRCALTFQHHAEVASLPIEVQERLLDQAERENWTTKQLRAAVRVRDQCGEDGCTRELTAVNSRIKFSPERIGTWRKAADTLGLDFDRWVTVNLDQAARQTLSDEYSVGA
jgi:hypothetical protein